ncbi:hypothetical protein TRFO_32133 [Tritrichomonas foetus]|uniref:PAS domain-containing protein n=1 Tax=Tritrichomonas foetus TaxID=1144522 RepID=A0A1J4JPV0_9EUKA|nr:hypothetical protein TRFO_32133 [Tritrichomonas foetus]|eukprot:OHT01183.1 hypothetical protein TRFO_32133 [Tritrichomonas foetus]
MLGHVVTPITLIPLFAHFGIGVVKAFELKEGKYYALLVLSAIGCMLNVVSSVLAVTFSANTVYFLNSEYIITNHIIVLTLLIGQGIFATFSYVSVVLGSEIEIAALILHLIFAIVMTVSGIVYTPFLFKWVNYSFGGLAIGSFFGDIFSRFLTTLEYRIVSVVIIWIVSSIIYKFIFDFFAKRLLRDESEKKINLKIQFSLVYDSESFISGKLFDKLSMYVNNSTNRLHIAKWSCFIHDFQPIFTAQIAMLRNATDLTFAQNFLLYQLCIAETGRQPLSSVPELNILRNETVSISTSIRAAWNHLHTDLSFGSFEHLLYDISLINNHWEEALNKYPRNALIAENYSRYLLECACDFDGCSEWHYRALQLQNGYYFEYDQATIHFLKLFPQYAKKLVNGVQLASLDDLDIKTSEEMLSYIVKHPKIHLEYQKAIQNYRSGWLNVMAGLIGFRFIIIIVYWMAMLGLFIGMFSSRQRNMQFLYDLSLIGESIELSDISITLQGGREYGETPTKEIADAIIFKGGSSLVDNQSLISLSDPLFDTSNYYSARGLKQLDKFIYNLNYYSSQGSDFQIAIDEMLKGRLNMTFMPTPEIGIISQNETFRTMLTYYLTAAALIGHSPLNLPAFNPWVFGGAISELVESSAQVLDFIEDVMQSFIDNDISDVESNKKMHGIITVVCIAIGIIFFVIFYTISFVCVRKQVDNVIDVCKNLRNEAINRASSAMSEDQIQMTQKSNTVTFANVNSSSYFTVLIFVIEMMVSLVSIGSIFAFYNQILVHHEFFTSMNYLLKQSTTRMVFSLKIFSDFLKSNLVDCPKANNPPGFEQKLLATFEKTIKVFTTVHEACLKGDYGNGKVYEKVNQLRRVSKCPSEWSNNYTYHESYACLPLDPAVADFLEMIKIMKTDICTRKYVRDERFVVPFHFLNSHLYYMLAEINDLLVEVGQEQSEDFDSTVQEIGLTVLAIAVLILLISLYNMNTLHSSYKTLIKFLLRIPPIDAVNNTKLMDILLGRKSSRKQTKMSLYEKIVKNSNFPIVFLNSSQVIENANHAFMVYFGYDISQIIGQNVLILTDDQDFYTQIKKINTIKSFELDLMKENKTQIHCELTVIPVSLNDPDKFEYYGLIIQDLSSVINKKRSCEELKKSNDNLIKSMLPKILMNDKEKISFDNAIILCLKLVHYGGNLTPAVFMQQRQNIFGKFDILLERQTLLTRVTINNGEYIVIGSSKDENGAETKLVEAAKQCVDFSNEVTSLFDDPAYFSDYVIGIDTGDVSFFRVGADRKINALHGSALSHARQLVRISNSGEIAISEKFYRSVATMEVQFSKMNNPIVGTFYLLGYAGDDIIKAEET